MIMEEEKLLRVPYAPVEFPSIRIGAAVKNKIEKNLCFVVGGGIGDRICAEPTLRYALENYKDVEISLACDTPELFSHLTFKDVFNFKDKFSIMGRHLMLYTYPSFSLPNEFLNPNSMNGVDFASMSSIRTQLPLEYRAIQNAPQKPANFDKLFERKEWALVHPGKGWPTKTFPADFWEKLIDRTLNYLPVAIVGNNTVDVDFVRIKNRRNQLIDLRQKTSLEDLAWLCKNANIVYTNDSSPLHLAAAGSAYVCFIPTCKRVDLLYHYRFVKNNFNLGMNMLGLQINDMWKYFIDIPNSLEVKRIHELPEGKTIDFFLPDPVAIVDFGLEPLVRVSKF